MREGWWMRGMVDEGGMVDERGVVDERDGG